MDILKQVEDKIKALALAVSHDETRPSLSLASVELSSESENGYLITATDGHVLLVINSIPWEHLVLFYKMIHSFELPETPTNGALNVNPKIKKQNKMPFFFTEDSENRESASYFPYPKWRNVVPLTFKNELIEKPFIASNTTERANKIFKLVSNKSFDGIKLWNGPLGASLAPINSLDSLLVMPAKTTYINTKGKEQNFDILKGVDLNLLECIDQNIICTEERKRIIEASKEKAKRGQKAVS